MLVIAKYKEDVTWANNLDRIVYDKEVIPNIGRESETYIRYILEHYNKLPEVISFCQGNPFDHCPDYLQTYNEIGFKGLDHTTYKDHCPHHNGLDVAGVAKLLKIDIPEEWTFKAGAQFTLSKEMILKHNKDFYKKINDIIINIDNAPWILERLWVHIFK